MWIELMTGRDSLRAQQSSPKRNVAVQAYTRVADDGEGRKIIPLWQAFSKKLKGFGKQSLISRLAATQHFAQNDAGEWFKTRFEVLPMTEILLEYRHRATSGFKENVEHLLLVADENAPLWQVRIDLPQHYLSAVPHAFFEGRFEIFNDDDKLQPVAIQAWAKFMGADMSEPYPLCFYTDPLQDPANQHFRLIQLEERIHVTSRVEVTKTDDGQKRVQIRRTRNIKVRK